MGNKSNKNWNFFRLVNVTFLNNKKFLVKKKIQKWFKDENNDINYIIEVI